MLIAFNNFGAPPTRVLSSTFVSALEEATDTARPRPSLPLAPGDVDSESVDSEGAGMGVTLSPERGEYMLLLRGEGKKTRSNNR